MCLHYASMRIDNVYCHEVCPKPSYVELASQVLQKRKRGNVGNIQMFKVWTRVAERSTVVQIVVKVKPKTSGSKTATVAVFSVFKSNKILASL